MSESYIISGTLFGDEGKGTIIDYLSHQKGIKENVRYNGGSQASHTVIKNGIKHKFSQLGSQALNPNAKTYLSENTVVNPFNIITEAKKYAQETGVKAESVIERVFISKDARVVTPYHTLIGKLRELSTTNNRRGSVGSGVSETTRTFEETGLEILMSDLEKMDACTEEKLTALYDFTNEFKEKNKDKINQTLLRKLINEKDIYYLTDPRNREYICRCYDNLMSSNLMNIVSSIHDFHTTGQDILFEGSQGLLIDKNCGIRPNTTRLDTTNNYGVKLAKDIQTRIHKIGAITPYTSRHGMGLLPTFDNLLQQNIFDENQTPSYYQGSPRYGWFDAVLARYSQTINNNDELFMTQIDRLSPFEKIKICNSYIYCGQITEDFINTFNFYKDGERIIITDIKQNSPNLRTYISKCIPMYIEMKGWSCDISNIKKIEDLPSECLSIIELIEYLVNTKISYLSIGPDRNQKLQRRSSWM